MFLAETSGTFQFIHRQALAGQPLLTEFGSLLSPNHTRL